MLMPSKLKCSLKITHLYISYCRRIELIIKFIVLTNTNIYSVVKVQYNVGSLTVAVAMGIAQGVANTAPTTTEDK